MTAKEKINKVLDYLNVKAPTFASSINVPYQRIYDMQRGKTANISGEVANAIVGVYPQFNITWLLAGSGDMILHSSDVMQNSDNTRISNRKNFKINLESFRKANGLVQQDVAKMFNCLQSNISEIERNKKPLEPYQRDILIEKFGQKELDKFLIENDSNIGEPEVTYGIAKRDSYQLVPLYNWDAVAGMHRFPEVVDTLQYAEMMIPFLGARTDDISIRISNDSMTPTYMPGSIILIREVERWQEYFGYGGVFVILLEDGRRLFKKILKHDSNPSEYVICSSDNKAYPDEELPRSLISKVFKLIRCLTDEDF